MFQEILLEIGFDEEMRTLEVIKRCPKPFSIILIDRENMIETVYLCSLATLHFAIL